MKATAWRSRLRWLSLPLAILALGWTVALLWNAWPQLRDNLPRLQIRWLLVTLAGTTISGYVSFEAFRALFRHMRPGLYDRLHLGHLYFTGQLMKHLPGRIWGIAYQSATGNQVSLSQWVAVTAVYMVLSTCFALWVAGIVLGWIWGWAWAGAALIVGFIAYGTVWRPRPMSAVLKLLRLIPGHVFGRFADSFQPFADVDASFKTRVLVLFGASWLIYMLSWIGYGVAWPDLTASDGVLLCAIYTVAWFAGYISLITPSGVGVRELVFVLMAHQFPADAVAGMAVLGRVTLLAVDVILVILFAPFREQRIHSHSR